MKIALLVNDINALETSSTTVALGRALIDRGHKLAVGDVSRLGVDPKGQPTVRSRRAEHPADGAPGLFFPEKERSVVANELDVILVRTNPARDPHRQALHRVALGILVLAERQGTPVLNAPRGLLAATSKLYLMSFSEEVRPPTLISTSAAEIRAFAESLTGSVILKPIVGTHGLGVFVVPPGDRSNLSSMVEVLVREGPAMAQGFVDAEQPGDVRVILVDGRPLEVDGAVAALRRLPASGDFRGNVHAGGHVVPAYLNEGMRRAIAEVGPALREDGLFCVGLDFVGDRIIEINAYSPGGVPDAEIHFKRPFLDKMAQAIEEKTKRARQELPS